MVREAVYEGIFDTPKTEAGVRQIPLSMAARQLVAEWRPRTRSTHPDALVFSTSVGQTDCAEQHSAPMGLPGV